MADLSPGSEFAGYRIDRVAGQGGMGMVLFATQLALDRPVALKVIVPELAEDVDFRARFKRESLLAASIDHPNVIPIYEAGESDGWLFLAMRWVDGSDVRSLISREGPLDPEHAVAIVERVGSALDAAHKAGLVHRDVKPANVLVTAGPEEHVYLTDFGLTKRAASAGGLTRTGHFIGTADYAAPEQIKGEHADARADVYALGCLLYQALTGNVPFDRDSEVAKMYAHLNDPPPAVSEAASHVPVALDAVIARALAKDRDERYPSAGDLARAARAGLAGTVVLQPERSLATGVAAPGADSTDVAPPAQTTEVAPAAATTDVAPAAATTDEVTAAAATDATPAGATTDVAPAAATTDAAPSAATTDVAPAAKTTAAAPREKPRLAEPEPARPPGRRRRPPAAIAAVLLCVVAAAGVLAVSGILSGDSEESGDGSGGGGGDTGTEPAVDSFPAGDGPDGIAVDGDTVYVTNAFGDTLTRLDAETGERIGTPVKVGNNPDGVAVADGVAWVVNTDDGTVSRLEEDSESPTVASVGSIPEGIALADQLVWVPNRGDGTVSRIDRASAQIVEPSVTVGERPVGAVVDDNAVWITNSRSDSVSRIDSSTSELIGDQIPVGDEPRGIAEGLGFIWVVNKGENTVTRLNPENGETVGKRITVGDTPKEVAVGLDFAWVANSEGDTVSKIDPETGKVVGDEIPVGATPVGIAVGADAVWVANNGDGTVTRIRP